MKNLLIVDGNSILNRAFYAIRPLTTRGGLPTNAVWGFVNILLKHLEELKPAYGAVAFDLPIPTFRHIYYKEYKATRHGMPDELAAQLPYAKQCVEMLGLKVITKEGYEADDILGTLSRLKCDGNSDVRTYILTGDRDSLQLINENVNVLLTLNSDTVVYDTAKFTSDYGVNPSVFVDVKALMGDSSDNIPGVAGVGEKTAFKLISSYGDLDALYKRLEDDPCKTKEITKSLRQKLIDGRESAYMSRFLAAIDVNVPLGLNITDIAYEGFNRTGLMELFKKLEFSALIKRLNLSADNDKIVYEQIYSPHSLKIDGTPALVVNNNVLYIACEAAHYSYSFGGQAECREFIIESGLDFCVYDSKKFCASLGIELFDKCKFDVMLAAYVLNSSDNSYGLSKLASSYLGETYDDDVNDADLIYRLYKVIADKIEADDQHYLYYSIELPLAGVLAEMESIGFKIDGDGLHGFSDKLQTSIDEYAERVYTFAGKVFNINSPKQLGEILFETLELPASKKKKTGYSTDAETLEKLRPYHPIIDSILEYRQVAKLKSTYADGLLKAADINGRVHTSFNQTVTATGRLSSTEPNLQNIPIRQPLGREMRKFFVPESSEYVLIDADYSQIELRLLADIAGDKVMINAFKNGTDIHTLTASQVFGVPVEAVTSELRKRAKAVNFGIVYGISDFSLAVDIGVSKYQAGEYIKSYLDKYPGVDAYLKNVIVEAREKGYVTTKYGRRRYIPELKSAKASLRNFGERVAMNSPIQGTAADVIKLAMINTEKELKASGIDAKLIMQVHDELIVEAHRSCADKAAEILKREMEGIGGFDVPLDVDVSIGDTWFM